jgi:hypothetical protein
MSEEKKKAVLFGPFVGEFYWEGGRFAPMLPYMLNKKYKGKDITYIVYTREDRFDFYGRNADILVPLKIDGDYEKKRPECFRLIGLKPDAYENMAAKFKLVYSKRYRIIEHVFPSVRKPAFLNKNQYLNRNMIFKYAPRDDNYHLVDEYLPKDGKPLIVLAPRYREGFKRNWKRWQDFYDLLYKDTNLIRNYNFIVCGKSPEYKPDQKDRFLNMNKIKLTKSSSSTGVLLAILERAYFAFGSQSAIPNLALLHGVEVLEFGCQKQLHTKIYNVKNTPITFIDNRKYDIEPSIILKQMNKLLARKRRKKDENKKHMDKRK